MYAWAPLLTHNKGPICAVNPRCAACEIYSKAKSGHTNNSPTV